MVQRRDDYTKYAKLAGMIRKVAHKIVKLEAEDPFRVECTAKLLDKLYTLNIIPVKTSLAACQSVNASAFCRRRLPVVMVRSHMAENLKTATSFIEQGHVRVGPEIVTDPAFLVTRNLEDFVTWVDTSAIKKRVLEYNDVRDDFDLM